MSNEFLRGEEWGNSPGVRGKVGVGKLLAGSGAWR